MLGRDKAKSGEVKRCSVEIRAKAGEVRRSRAKQGKAGQSMAKQWRSIGKVKRQGE